MFSDRQSKIFYNRLYKIISKGIKHFTNWFSETLHTTRQIFKNFLGKYISLKIIVERGTLLVKKKNLILIIKFINQLVTSEAYFDQINLNITTFG